MTSFSAMSVSSEGALSETIIFFAIIALICTCFVVLWLIKGSKDIKSPNRGANIQNKRKGSIPNKQQQLPQPPKKKIVTKQNSKGSVNQSPKFEHPHLVSTLKGHTGHLTGGDFSSNGKQFITAAEVARAYVIPNVEDEKSKASHFKAINHDEKGSMWSTDSLSSSSNAPSDTEDSLTSSSSCSLKMSRRQKKNKKRKKSITSDKNSVKSKSKNCVNNNINSSNYNNNNNNNNNSSSSSSSSNNGNNNKKNIKTKLVDNEIIIESVIRKEKKSKKCKTVPNVSIKVNIDFHKLLLPFCTNVQERILSGFPYQTYRGTYVFKSFGFSRLESVLGDHRLVDAEIIDVDLKNYVNSMDEEDDISSNYFMQKNATVNDFSSFKYKNFYCNSGNVQKCERCRQFFDVGQNGRTLCIFHPKKAILTNEGALRYVCCNSFKNGGGCQAYTFHVYHHLSIGINGPLEGYISTQPLKRLPKVYGLDCEMVFTTQGFEVARSTLVDVYGEVVLDIFVQPEGIILDYNTQFSGITEDSLYNALPFSEMQNLFLQYVSSSDILVGHSLDGDLVVLKILHRRVVDSSLLFLDIPRDTTTNGSSPLPRRQALKSLVKQHLGQDIQMSGPCGHNSKEDATASLNLVLNKVCGESFKEAQRGKRMQSVPGL